MLKNSLFVADKYVVVTAELVRIVGGNEAIVLSHLRFRCAGDPKFLVHHDGAMWWEGTLSEVSEWTGLTLRVVQSVVAKLVDNGFLEREKFHRKGSSDHTYSYRVNVQDSATLAIVPNGIIDNTKRYNRENGEKGPKRGLLPNDDAIVPNGIIDNTKRYNLLSINKLNNNDHFDTIWAKYPKKVGKGKAREAFFKALKKTSVDTISDSIDNHVKFWQGTELQFIPHFATWLNQERWSDEVAVPSERKVRVKDQWMVR